MGRPKNKQLIEKVILKIKRTRELKKVTLQEFYNDTGIHLARIESQKRDIPISTLQKICEYFGTNLSEFLKGF